MIKKKESIIARQLSSRRIQNTFLWYIENTKDIIKYNEE